MAKYDAQLTDLKNQLSQAKKIAVISPAVINVDKLAAALALFLALKQAGKDVTVISEGTLTVAHSHLYGVGEIAQTLTAVSGGDLTLTLEGVVDNQGKVPALEKLDWYPEGNNLNLVFHTLPGQKFEPTKIDSKYSGSGIDLIFIVGANNASELGNVYSANNTVFEKSTTVVIDNVGNFGKINITDPEAVSVSEMMIQVLEGLNLPFDADIASNLVAGIYDATQNLTVNLKPDTFMALGFVTRQGGKLPQPGQETKPYPYDMSQFLPKEQLVVQPQVVPQPPVSQPTPVAEAQTSDNFITPQVVNEVLQAQPQTSQNQAQPVASGNEPSPARPAGGSFASQNEQSSFASQNEERPHGEAAYSGNPEVENPAPDWLTPKIYKGVG